MTLVFRRDLSRNLTAAEADGNIDDLNGRITTVEGVTASGGITSMTVSGSTLTLHFSDSTTQSVDLGTANAYSLSDHVRGSWLPTTAYVKDDIFVYQGSLYVVAYPHTSAGTFDENSTTSGHNNYKVICRFGEGVITVSTTTATPNASYANKYIRCTNAAGCTITLNANVFAPADRMTFRQCGAGGLIFEWPTGVTVNVVSGYQAATAHIGAVVTVFIVGAAEYDVFGLLSA